MKQQVFDGQPSRRLQAQWGRSVRSMASALALGLALGACGGTTPEAEAPPPPPLDDGEDSPAPIGQSPKVKEAEGAIQAGDLDKAKGLLEAALADNDEDPLAHHYLGVALDGLKDLDGAKKHYRKALELAPKLFEAAINLGAILIDVDKDYEGALKVTDAALKESPKEAQLLLNRALALESLKRPEAVDAYGAAVAATPDDPQLRFAYADMLLAAGKADEAVAQLDKLESEDLKILSVVAVLYGKAKAFAKCVATIDKALKPLEGKNEPPQLYTRRAACRAALKDNDGATADYQKAIDLEPKKAAGHFYLGKHLLAIGQGWKGKVALKKALALDPDGKVGAAAKKALAK